MGTDRNKEASEALRVAICNSLRRGDFYTRYKESQYQDMLSGTTLENCQVLSYRLSGESGPDHAKVFAMEVLLIDGVIGSGQVRS